MEQQIVEIGITGWRDGTENTAWITALEAGKVLYFPHLAFTLTADEQVFLTPDIRDPKTRNISLDAAGCLKGAVGDVATQIALAAMIGRFRRHAQALIESLFPRYAPEEVPLGHAPEEVPLGHAPNATESTAGTREVPLGHAPNAMKSTTGTREVFSGHELGLRLAPTSYRPSKVETRAQSWRADDRRLHIDAFPSRPNHGERILRVFANVHPGGVPRMWRIGEPFEVVAKHFLPQVKPYAPWQAQVLRALRVTKSLRSEYDHLMLQLHDRMKSDLDYQQDAQQVTMPFAAGSVWVCFSDQASHAVMSGQYMLEQTLHLPVARQYDPTASPLAILTRLTDRALT